MAIHGITQEMVADAPTEAEILPKIAEFIGDYPIVAHNAIFDHSLKHTKEYSRRNLKTKKLILNKCSKKFVLI